jgi:proline iminopeptidase
MSHGRLVEISDTRLFVEERGEGQALPLVVLHGGPGLDHHVFADYLDPITAGGHVKLLLVDERAQGRSDRTSDPATWTLERMAKDVSELAAALSLETYAVLGHSFGSFLALQHAIDEPGDAAATILVGSVPSSRWLERVQDELEAFEPAELRQQVIASWEAEKKVESETAVEDLYRQQLPFHFRDPRDPRIDEYLVRAKEVRYSPAVLRHFASRQYGGIEAEARLGEIAQPVLVLSGRYDRVCPAEAGEFMAEQISDAELVVFEESAHMSFVEEPQRFQEAVVDFLGQRLLRGGI